MTTIRLRINHANGAKSLNAPAKALEWKEFSGLVQLIRLNRHQGKAATIVEQTMRTPARVSEEQAVIALTELFRFDRIVEEGMTRHGEG